jgi:hypothetical protein
LEEHPTSDTLTAVKSVKLAITLILGLVFQLAQVLPGASFTSPSHATFGEPCACCPDVQSCDCAENGDPEQESPSPALPDTGSLLKVPAAKADDSPVSANPRGKTATTAKTAACPRDGPVHGYTGISLSVAFCSFVI